jgi:epoxyqueuosine reductase
MHPVSPELIPLLEITAEEFARRFGHTPVKRARREGLQRNAAIALGNSGDRAAVPALARALRTQAPLVRAHAAWALGHLGGCEAAQALRRALDEEMDEVVRDEIVAALDACGESHESATVGG